MLAYVNPTNRNLMKKLELPLSNSGGDFAPQFTKKQNLNHVGRLNLVCKLNLTLLKEILGKKSKYPYQTRGGGGFFPQN